MSTGLSGLPVAVDAMGGDRAPLEIVAGARRAADELGIPVVLVGPTDGSLGDTGGLEVIPASEVITMSEDAARAVRTKKDSSLVRAAEAVRDGRACAMVSAGNTGATMASALLRMGRLRGVARPCIATPLPALGDAPTVLVDAGAHGVGSLDTVFLNFGDLEGLRREAEDAAAMGFMATPCVHPSQVEVVRDAYRPTETQVAFSKEVLAHAAQHGGVFRLGDVMVDGPVVAQARQILRRAGEKA